MSRRIVGQCNTSDFMYLEHLSDAMSRGIEPDLTNLTNRQKIAVLVLRHFQQCGVDFKVLLKIKEVLAWEYDNKKIAFEYKLLDLKDKMATYLIISKMVPIKVDKED